MAEKFKNWILWPPCSSWLFLYTLLAFYRFRSTVCSVAFEIFLYSFIVYIQYFTLTLIWIQDYLGTLRSLAYFIILKSNMPIFPLIYKFLIFRQFLKFSQVFTLDLHGFPGRANIHFPFQLYTFWPLFPLLESISQVSFNYNYFLCLFALTNVCQCFLLPFTELFCTSFRENLCVCFFQRFHVSFLPIHISLMYFCIYYLYFPLYTLAGFYICPPYNAYSLYFCYHLSCFLNFPYFQYHIFQTFQASNFLDIFHMFILPIFPIPSFFSNSSQLEL